VDPKEFAGGCEAPPGASDVDGAAPAALSDADTGAAADAAAGAESGEDASGSSDMFSPLAQQLQKKD
jgi:hypothetical protein